MREACPTGRRDSAAENSVFRSFEVLFLFTIAVIHYGKLELYVLPDLFGRICTRLFFPKQFTASSNKEKTQTGSGSLINAPFVEVGGQFVEGRCLVYRLHHPG
jgi:hypothetical protein